MTTKKKKPNAGSFSKTYQPPGAVENQFKPSPLRGSAEKPIADLGSDRSEALCERMIQKLEAGGDPEGHLENLKARLELLRKCRRDAQVREETLARCKRDFLFWVNMFVWQHNPRQKGDKVGPFVTWDFQDEIYPVIKECLDQGEDLLIEKSREMGMSWFVLLVFDHEGRFGEWLTFTLISHMEKAVDTPNSPSSLFWKLDFVHRHLPDWMGARDRQKLSVLYPKTESTITGQATTERSTVGGRNTGVLLDEFAKQKKDRDIWGNTADVGPRIIVSTHYGTGTLFYELCQSGFIRKVVVHWSRHPEKKKGLYTYAAGKVEVIDKQHPFLPDYKFVLDGKPTGGPCPGLRSPWYDKEVVRRGNERDVAMHLDIDAKGSTFQVFPAPLLNKLKAYCVPAYWEGDILYDEAGRPEELVPVPGGPLKLWMNLSGGKPKPGVYALGGDVAVGTGATCSTLAIGDATTGEKVGMYRNAHISPERFAYVAVALAWLFSNDDGYGALLAWEIPGPGSVFGNKVIDLGYRNVFWRKPEFITIRERPTERPGWFNTNETMQALILEYISALTNGTFLNRSESSLEECKLFKYDERGFIVHAEVRSQSDPSGARINHSDDVIADAICNKMLKRLALPAEEKKKADVPVLSLQWRWDQKKRERQTALGM